MQTTVESAHLSTFQRLAAVAALLLLVPAAVFAQDDPPDQAARLSWASGTVSVQPSGTEDWGQAYPNLTVAPGDRIYTDSDGWAEMQIGQTYLRIGPNTDVTLLNGSDQSIDFGVGQGAVHLRTFGLWPDQVLNVSTPNGNMHLETAGEARVDVMPDDNASIFTNLGIQAGISGADGFEQLLGEGQVLELYGTNPVSAQWLQAATQDNLDAWSRQRDEWIQQSASYQYVSPDVPGAADLDANGDWTPDTDYGPMWFPRSVPVGWAPYHNGHWIYRVPWGWVWVEDESWGYAPFHYGRWAQYRGRWGWVPGPRGVRSVWSPALVVFAGGMQTGGVSLSAWFPLGPGEPYRPWYRCSPNYLDRVNITNIRASRRVKVWKSYENTKRFENIRYMNRTTGVSAMRHDDFAAGRNMRQAGVKVDPRQFEHVKVLTAPQPAPGNHVLIARPIAPQRPGMRERPEFINRQGMITSTRPGAGLAKPPVRALPPARIPRGRQAVPPPSETGTQPHGTPGAAPPRPYGRPVPAPAGNAAREAGQPNRGNQRQGAPAAPRVERPVGRPVPAPPAAYERERGPDGRGTDQQPAQGPDVRPLGRPMPSPPARQQQEPEPQPPQQPHGQPHEREVRPPDSQSPDRHQDARPAPSPQKARNAEKQQKHEESKPQPNVRKGRFR